MARVCTRDTHVPQTWQTSKVSFDGELPTLPAVNPASDEFAANMRALTARAKRCMMAAQQRQKRYYDANRP